MRFFNTHWTWQQQMKWFNGSRNFFLLQFSLPKNKQSPMLLFKVQWSNIGANFIITLINIFICEWNIWNCIFRCFCDFSFLMFLVSINQFSPAIFWFTLWSTSILCRINASSIYGSTFCLFSFTSCKVATFCNLFA